MFKNALAAYDSAGGDETSLADLDESDTAEMAVLEKSLVASEE